MPCLTVKLPKHFGSATVLSDMLSDFNDLEENRITIHGETVKEAIAGDSFGLTQHWWVY